MGVISERSREAERRGLVCGISGKKEHRDSRGPDHFPFAGIRDSGIGRV